MGFENDASVARELEMFIDNDSQLYRSQHTPIIKNLMTKHAQGRYNSALAVKLFMYLVDNGAKKYAKEHGGPGAKWNDMFPKKIRTKTAEALRDSFEDEAKLGNYDDMIPKKYKGKVSGKTLGEDQEPEGEAVSEAGPLFDGETRKALSEAAGVVEGEMMGGYPVLTSLTVRKVEESIAAIEKNLSQAKSSLTKVKAGPKAMAPQAHNLQVALNAIRSSAERGYLFIEKNK